MRLATLRSIDRLRRNRPSVELRECDRMSTVEPFEAVAATELAQWLRSAIAQLPDQQATVFVMFHFEQLSRDEVSAALGISPDSRFDGAVQGTAAAAIAIGRLQPRRFEMSRRTSLPTISRASDRLWMPRSRRRWRNRSRKLRLNG